jgi:hypothetical protein
MNLGRLQLGMKNWMFFGSVEAGTKNSDLSTLKIHQIEKHSIFFNYINNAILLVNFYCLVISDIIN